MLELPTRFNVSTELPEARPDQLVISSSGTTANVSIDLLRQFNSSGVRPGELQVLLDAIAREQEREQEDEVMVSATEEDSGVPNYIRIIPGRGEHGPRIKVMLNPKDRWRDNGDWAYVLFGEAPGSFNPPRPGRAGGPVPEGELLELLKDFVEQNRRALFLFDRDPDQGGITGTQLVKGLKKARPRGKRG